MTLILRILPYRRSLFVASRLLRTHRHEPPVAAGDITIVSESDDEVVVDKPCTVPIHPCGSYRWVVKRDALQVVPRSLLCIYTLKGGAAFVVEALQHICCFFLTPNYVFLLHGACRCEIVFLGFVCCGVAAGTHGCHVRIEVRM